MSLFEGPVKRPPLRNTYGSRRWTKQQRQPDGSGSALVASVTAGATEPDSLSIVPRRDRSVSASASSVADAAVHKFKKPAARHEHGTPPTASSRMAYGQAPTPSTGEGNDVVPPPSPSSTSRKRKQTPTPAGRALVKSWKRVIVQDRASTSESSSSSDDEVHFPLGSGKRSGAVGSTSSSSPLAAAPPERPQRPAHARADGSRSSPRLRPEPQQQELDAASGHAGERSSSPCGTQARARKPRKRRRIDMMDQDEGSGEDQSEEDAAGARESSLPTLHTAESSASSSRPPHESAALPVPAAKGHNPASFSGRSDGEATGPTRAMIQPQQFSAKMASASTTEPGLEAQEAQQASVPAPESYAAVEAINRTIEHTRPSAQESATIAKRTPLALTEKVPRAPVIHPASSASRKSPVLQADHSVDFDFDDLLDKPASSTLQVLHGAAVPKRGPLVRHMSARSEAGSEAGTPSIFPSPAGTPNKRVRADSAGYFGSPARSTGSAPGSPMRGLQATNSVPDLLGAHAATGASLPGSRASTPFLQTGDAGGAPSASPTYASRPPPASPPPGRAKRTYGQSRSILPETDLAAPLAPMAIFAPAIAETSRPSFLQRNSSAFADLHERADRSRAGSSVGGEGGSGDEDDDDEEDLTESQAQLHSINQLRSAGESKRFADEIHYLLDGFGDSAVSVHRASAIEILRKLSDESWMKKLLAFGYVQQVYDSFRAARAGDGDRVLDTCLVALVARLVQHAQCGELLLAYPAGFDCLKALGRVAAQPWAKEQILPGISRLGKTEKRLLGSIKSITESWWQAAGQKTSARSIIIDTLAVMLEGQLPEGHSPASTIAGTTLFEQTLEALPASLPGSPISEMQQEDVRRVHSCARIILAVLESPGPSSSGQLLALHAPRTAPGLVNALTSCRDLIERSRAADLALLEMVASTMKLVAILMETSDAWHHAITAPLRTDLIPALFAYTHATENTRMPDATATSPVPSSTPSSAAMQQSRSQGSSADSALAVTMARLDILCLSLTLLQTLLESSSEARKAFRKDDSASTGESALIHTVLLYARFQKDAATQPEMELLAKYCSLLVVYGMLGDRTSQTAVIAALRGAPSDGALAALTTTLEELQALHAQGSQDGVDTQSISGSELEEAVELFRASR